MKVNVKNTLCAAFVGLTMAALSVQAQGKLTNLDFITVAFTLQSQGSFSDDGTTRIYASSVTRKLNTKDLLNQLARDKFAQGSYVANYFPNGSQLALSGGLFVVVDRNSQLIVDVSDILQLTYGTNAVLNGRINDTTGLASPKITEAVPVQLAFDDTQIAGGGNVSFTIQGLDTIQTKDTALLLSAGYKETSSDSVKNISGAGQTSGTSFNVTGSIHGSRSEKIPAP
jgi:hypothetical protein